MRNEKVLDMESFDYLYNNNNNSVLELDESIKEEKEYEIQTYHHPDEDLSLKREELNNYQNNENIKLEKDKDDIMIQIPIFNQDEISISNIFIPKIEPDQIAYKNIFNIYNENGLFKQGYSKSKDKKGNNQNDRIEEKININKLSLKTSIFKIHKRNEKKIVKRKEKPDDIRKKIKSRFFKAIKNKINKMLENANSKMYFDYLPQSFIIDVSRQTNKSIVNMSYRELLLYECVYNYIDYQKYEHNIEVVDYLDKNADICKNSHFNKIGEMKIRDIFKGYLENEDFKLELENLKNKEFENDEYIHRYKELAENFITYYSK